MANRLFTLAYNVVDGASRAFVGIGRSVAGLVGQLGQLNQATEFVGKAFDKISTGFGLGPALVEAGNFEDTLTRVQIKTGATADEMGVLRDSITSALGTARFSADEAAAGLGTMAESGLSAADAAQQLGTVLAFAQTNALGASDAAGGLADTLDLFGASADQIGVVADALTATATAAGTTGKQLQDALLASGWHTRTWTARKGYAMTEEARDNSASETIWCSPHCVPEVGRVLDLFSEAA